MKKIFSIMLMMAFCTALIAQDNDVLEGNGKLVTREVKVAPFNAIKASGIYELKLVQGNAEGVTIEADENLQDYFEVKNEGQLLVLSMKKIEKKRFNSKNKTRITVSFKKLSEMELSNIGDVASGAQLDFNNLSVKNKNIGKVDLALKADKLTFHNSGVGDITLKGSAGEANVKNTGVGSFMAGDFIVQTVNIENSGVGNAEVNAIKKLEVSDHFLGKVKNRGAAEIKKVKKVRL